MTDRATGRGVRAALEGDFSPVEGRVPAHAQRFCDRAGAKGVALTAA